MVIISLIVLVKVDCYGLVSSLVDEILPVVLESCALLMEYLCTRAIVVLILVRLPG